MKVLTKSLVTLGMLSAGLAIGLLRPRTADADTYPGTNDGRFPDGGSHVGCWVPNPSTATIPSPIWQHLFNYMDTTVQAATGLDVAWTTDCSNLADMRLDDRDTDPDRYGVRFCAQASGNICLGNNVLINKTTIAADATASITVAEFERKVWCHETGHSAGLGHENGCLVSGLSENNTYSAHHITHLNAQF
ncbi:MAG: hypothetical protein RL685_6649 [Pseudomonadota bacterium]